MPTEKVYTITKFVSTNISTGGFHISYLCKDDDIITLKMNEIQIAEFIRILTKEQTRTLIHQEYHL